MGSRTYGKGLIQSIYELHDASGLALTVGCRQHPAEFVNHCSVVSRFFRIHYPDAGGARPQHRTASSCTIESRKHSDTLHALLFASRVLLPTTRMHNATCSPSPPRLHHTLLLHNIRWGGTAHRAARTSTGRASRPTSVRRRQRSWRPRGCAPAWRRRGAPRNRIAAEWVAHRVELKEQHPQAACGWRGSQQGKRPPEGGWRCIASDNSCNWPVRTASP